MGNRGPRASSRAGGGLPAVAGAACLALLTYLWSYRRHRVRLLESPAMASRAQDRNWLGGIADRLIPDPRERAAVRFIAKRLARSRQPRRALHGFCGLRRAADLGGFRGRRPSRGVLGRLVQAP